jgi:hypothetical protein
MFINRRWTGRQIFCGPDLHPDRSHAMLCVDKTLSLNSFSYSYTRGNRRPDLGFRTRSFACGILAKDKGGRRFPYFYALTRLGPDSKGQRPAPLRAREPNLPAARSPRDDPGPGPSRTIAGRTGGPDGAASSPLPGADRQLACPCTVFLRGHKHSSRDVLSPSAPQRAARPQSGPAGLGRATVLALGAVENRRAQRAAVRPTLAVRRGRKIRGVASVAGPEHPPRLPSGGSAVPGGIRGAGPSPAGP